MLDLDGTIYQTLDLKEAAYHATKANGRSVGIEIANMGAYPAAELATSPLSGGTPRDADGRTEIRLPAGASVPTHPSPPARSARAATSPIVGDVQGQELRMYDLTPEQYAALAKLTPALCATFPKIRPDAARATTRGKSSTTSSTTRSTTATRAILGHFHVQPTRPTPAPRSSGIGSCRQRLDAPPLIACGSRTVRICRR